jgi:hypothetical protein
MSQKSKIIVFLSLANRWFVGEVLILFMLVLTVNNFLGNTPKTIAADGIMYYDYLPSVFLYKDFGVQEKVKDENKEFSRERIDLLIQYKGKYLNKYPVGTAVLIAPFYFYADATATARGYERDAYSEPYQRAIFYAAIFYLFLGLVFLKCLCRLYDISDLTIFITQILAALGTNIYYYTTTDSAFSHVYSFFTITAFLFFAKKYFNELTLRDFLWACFFLGFTILIRQINLLVFLAVPFIAGSWQKLSLGIQKIFKQYTWLINGILLVAAILSIQVIAWYIQTGEYIIYSYQGESFDFSSPHFIDILFSYEKGLFIYTPVVFLSVFGLFIWLKKREYYSLFSWLAFFSLLTYVLSSWWAWGYGCSFGLRAYIDYFSFFFIPIAVFIEHAKRIVKIVLIPIAAFFIYLNIVQSFQYKRFILHWVNMDQQKYWDVFLRTDKRFEGYTWKGRDNYDFVNHPPVIYKSVSVGDVTIKKESSQIVYTILSKDIPHFDSVDFVEIKLDATFLDDEDARTELSITDSSGSQYYYSYSPYLLHFIGSGLNTYQRGYFNFFFPPISESNLKIAFRLTAAKRDVILKNIEINFYKKTE